jgi:hypothetical protein
MFSRRGLHRLGWSNEELDEAGGSIASDKASALKQ